MHTDTIPVLMGRVHGCLSILAVNTGHEHGESVPSLTYSANLPRICSVEDISRLLGGLTRRHDQVEDCGPGGDRRFRVAVGCTESRTSSTDRLEAVAATASQLEAARRLDDGYPGGMVGCCSRGLASDTVLRAEAIKRTWQQRSCC